MKTKIKKGDTVKVISGSYKGSVGKVIEVLPQSNRVRIEGQSSPIAPIKRHIKPQKNPRRPEGGIIEAIAVGAREVDPDGTRHTVEVDRAVAIRRAIRLAQADDMVLIAGKGHETYQLIGGRRLDFDDRLHARQALEELRAGD